MKYSQAKYSESLCPAAPQQQGGRGGKRGKSQLRVTVKGKLCQVKRRKTDWDT